MDVLEDRSKCQPRERRILRMALRETPAIAPAAHPRRVLRIAGKHNNINVMSEPVSAVRPASEGRRNHPLAAPPPLAALERRHQPALITLMILIWGLFMAGVIYKGMVPRSGMIIVWDS